MRRLKPTGKLRQRQPRKKDPKYLLMVKEMPCVICMLRGRLNSPCDAAHVRYGDPAWDKRPTGMAEKPDDKFCLPLCDGHHRNSNEAQHNHGEREWWANMHIDPVKLCILLYEARDDANHCIQIIRSTTAIARQSLNSTGGTNAENQTQKPD